MHHEAAAAPARDPKRAESDGFRPDVEGLRGVAVSLVVVFHLGLLSGVRPTLPGGFIGVDLFFVISGFLITGLLIREHASTGRVSLWRFYARRVRRILPAATVVLLVTLPAAYLLLAPLDRAAAMKDGASAALSIANVRFAITTDYFNPESYSPFLHFWSLGVEEQFYFVWPALLGVVAWKMPRGGIVLTLAAVLTASLAASVLVTQAEPSWAFYMLPTRAWQLAAGGLLAAAAGPLGRMVTTASPRMSGALALAGWAALVGLLALSIALDSRTTPYPGIAAVPPTLAGVVLVALGTLRRGPGLFLCLAPVRFVGRISYSLYLWHWPVLILGSLYLKGPQLEQVGPRQGILLVALAFLLATLSWWLVEEPFRRGRVRLPARQARVVAGGVAVMLVVAIAGSALDWGAGQALAADRAQAASARLAKLRPAIETAPRDYESLARACRVGYEEKVPDPSCVAGAKDGAYRVALIGDSHASALSPAVEAVAKTHGWRLEPYLKVGCPFVDVTVYNPSLKREYTECRDWNRAVVSALDAAPPDLVLVTMSSWVGSEDGKGVDPVVLGNSLGRMIDALPAATRVVIVQDPPHPPKSAPTCLSANTDDFDRCAYPRKAALAGRGILEKAASKVTGAPVVDLTREVCPGTGPCPVVIDDMIVWRDKDHLTATFATALGPALDAKLTKALGEAAAPK